MLLLPIGNNLLVPKDIDPHVIEADQVHGVLAEVRLVLLPVALGEKPVVSDGGCQLRIQGDVFPEGQVLQCAVQEDLLLKILVAGGLDAQGNVELALIAVGLFRVEQVCIERFPGSEDVHGDGLQDVPLLLRLAVPIPGKGILEPPELAGGIAAEGIERPPGQEEPSVVPQHLPDAVHVDHIPVTGPKHLDDVRVAGGKEPCQLPEAVDGGIRIPVHELLLLPFQGEQGTGMFQEPAAKVIVGIGEIRPVGAGTAEGEIEDVVVQERLVLEERVCGGLEDFVFLMQCQHILTSPFLF